MEFGGDERAQSVLVGSILLFAILIVAFSTYQAFVVPSQNAEVEFTHSQQVENEFSAFRSNVVNAVESDDVRSTSFTLGTRYPTRLIALNPTPPAGSISTTDAGQLEIEGHDMGEICGLSEATSRSLVYEPGYNEYRSAESIVYEHTFVAATFREGTSISEQQRLIDEERIDLLLVTGEVSETRTGAFGIDVNASHRYSYGTVDGPTVTLPSQFDAETWETRILENRADILDVEDVGDGRIRIELDGSFQVTCAVAGLNGDPAFQPPVETDDETDDGTDDGTEGGAGPSIDSFTTGEQPGNNIGIRYSFEVSAGDADLDQAVVELRRDGTPVDERTHDLGGTQDGVNNEEFEDLGSGQEYTLKLTVTDVDGQSATETRTQEAG